MTVCAPEIGAALPVVPIRCSTLLCININAYNDLHSSTCDAGDACQGAWYTAFQSCKPVCYLGKEYPLAASEAGACIKTLLSGHGAVRLFS